MWFKGLMKPMKSILSTESSLKGFTLVELVVAITILSMVTLIIGSGFRLGIDAWEKGEKETGETQRLRVLSGLLSQQLKSAYPYKMEIEDEKKIVFKGDTHSIIFVTTQADPSYGGFKWIRYSYKNGNLLYAEGLLPDKKFLDKISKNEEIMDSDMEEVKFEYFSVNDEEWKDSWDFGDGLPGAVRVKISYFQPFLINIPLGIKSDEEKEDEIL
jgi:general secretion pathway protein J